MRAAAGVVVAEALVAAPEALHQTVTGALEIMAVMVVLEGLVVAEVPAGCTCDL